MPWLRALTVILSMLQLQAQVSPECSGIKLMQYRALRSTHNGVPLRCLQIMYIVSVLCRMEPNGSALIKELQDIKDIRHLKTGQYSIKKTGWSMILFRQL